jgi:hypothetical protein
MRIVSELNIALTPVGNPVATPIPVAPEVVCVMVPKDVLIHKVGVDDAALVVLSGVIVIVPLADTVPQPPVNGIL